MSRFQKLVGVDVRPNLKEANGMDYIQWTLALSLAGRPNYSPVIYDTPLGHSNVREVFGAGVVGVDMDIGNGTMQRITLVVTDRRNSPIPYAEANSRDVSDKLGRCAARAAAMVHGLGLSLYSECRGDGPTYAQALNVSAETKDLSRVEELRDKKGKGSRAQEYLPWHAALAAARITDPDFWWEVIECQVLDPSTGALEMMPMMKNAGPGWQVGVRIHHRGTVHIQWSAITGVLPVKTKNGVKPMDHQPLPNPDANDWHRTIMRCLTKAIAVGTGYGIASYAGLHEPFDADEAEEVAETKEQGASADQKPPAAPSQERQETDPEVGELIGNIRKLVTDSGTDRVKFLAWLGVPSLDKAPPAVLERGHAALLQKLKSNQTNH